MIQAFCDCVLTVFLGPSAIYAKLPHHSISSNSIDQVMTFILKEFRQFFWVYNNTWKVPHDDVHTVLSQLCSWIDLGTLNSFREDHVFG